MESFINNDKKNFVTVKPFTNKRIILAIAFVSISYAALAQIRNESLTTVELHYLEKSRHQKNCRVLLFGDMTTMLIGESFFLSDYFNFYDDRENRSLALEYYLSDVLSAPVAFRYLSALQRTKSIHFQSS